MEVRPKFFARVERGETVDKAELLALLQTYKRIIVWGAGNLGVALGHYFKVQGIKVEAYWDSRFQELSECNGIEVGAAFSAKATDDLLIIIGITNAFVTPKLKQQLDEQGYQFISGMAVYQTLICPVSIDIPNIEECLHRKECNVAICDRYRNTTYLLNNDNNKLFINTVDIYVTQRCSLKCKYCYIYENSYPLEKRVDYPLDRILRDVDEICEAASFINRMVPFGGEPFLNPHLGAVIEHMASKENVGVIDIISNGVFNADSIDWSHFKHENVKINVSNYNQALNSDLVRLREKNIEEMIGAGLNVIVHNETPEWRKPGLFTRNELSDNDLRDKKKYCGNFTFDKVQSDTVESLIVKNGRIFACQYCDTAFQLGFAEKEEDCINLDEVNDVLSLPDRIKELFHKDYYEACRYCNSGIELVEVAGEQGVDDRYIL